MFGKLIFQEFKDKFFWRAVVAEFLATAIYLFVVTAVGLNLVDPSIEQPAINKCLPLGLAAAVLVKLFAPVSGAYFNPAVTMGAYINGDISSPRATMYGAVQYLGGIIGAGLTYILTPGDRRGILGSVKIASNVTVAQGFFMELVLSLIVTLVILVSYDKKRCQSDGPSSIIIGFAYIAMHFVGMQYTGAAINPARALGPSLITNYWPSYNWVYWIAPYVGASIAGVLYRFILSIPEPKEKNLATVTVTDIGGSRVTLEMNGSQ